MLRMLLVEATSQKAGEVAHPQLFRVNVL